VPPSGVHHVSVQTDRPEEIRTLLQVVLGQERSDELDVSASSTRLLQWSPPTATVARFYGAGSIGAIEVVEIPADQRGRECSRPLMPTYAVRDVVGAVELCRRLGLEVTGPVEAVNRESGLLAAVVTAGGVRFELVQFVRGDPLDAVTTATYVK
jgi:hypothetical protein